MKIKIFILGCIFMSTTQIGYSQVSLGIQGGISLFTWKNQEKIIQTNSFDREVSFTNGYYAGITVPIRLNKNFSLQPELSYVGKGYKMDSKFKYDPTFTDYISSSTLHSYYIELPVLLKYHVPLKSEKLGLEIGLGISLGYLIDQNQKIIHDNNIFHFQYETYDPNGYIFGMKENSLDIAGILDISLPIYTKWGDFIIGSRTSLDMNDRYQFEGVEEFEYEKNIYNWGMVFYTGYIISYQ